MTEQQGKEFEAITRPVIAALTGAEGVRVGGTVMQRTNGERDGS